jgi:hypothetical protein
MSITSSPTALSFHRGTATAQVYAGAVLVLAGLGLILLGGCFLLGIYGILHPEFFGTPPPPNPLGIRVTSVADEFLNLTLYAAAFACFAGAAVLTVKGSRGLLRVLNDRPDAE